MRSLFLVLVSLLISLITSGQSILIKRVENYSLKEGLSSSVIHGISQDNRGFMWFATSDGLNRFDGRNFKVFKYDAGKPEGLPENFIQVIFKDHLGHFWIVARKGLYSFNPVSEQFSAFLPSGSKDPPLPVATISESKKGVLWLSCLSSGFASFDIEKRVYTVYSAATLHGLPKLPVVNVMQDSYGLVWVALQGGGIRVFNQGPHKRLTLNTSQKGAPGLDPGRIYSVYEDHNQNIWIAGNKGLVLYTRTDNRLRLFNGRDYQLRSGEFYSIMEDGSGNLLAGLQDGGLYSLQVQLTKEKLFERLRIGAVRSEDSSIITARTVQALFRDRDSNIWAGTYGEGVYMLATKTRRFKKIQTRMKEAEGSSLVRYYGMCVDENKNLWLGTDGDGIYKLKPGGELIRAYRSGSTPGALTDNSILSALKDHSNTLWFGSYAHGLYRFNKATETFTNFIHTETGSRGLGSNDIRVLFEDSEKNLWVGTNGGGLSLLCAGHKEFLSFNAGNSSLTSNDIRALCEDRGGNLFIGTYGSGLWYYDKKARLFTPFFSKAQITGFLPGQVIFSLYLHADSELFIGTEGNGLISYNLKSRKFRHFTEENGLADNTVNSIQDDGTGNLWISTTKGLSEIEINTGKVKNFDSFDGLQNGQFNPSSSLYASGEKKMIFGGTEGYNVFDPGLIKQGFFKPAVVITGLQVYGYEIDSRQHDQVNVLVPDDSRPLILKPTQQVFTINYQALTYDNSERTEYAFMLSGFENRWNYVKTQSSVTYRYLPAGNYIFQVKARNHDGLWSVSYARLHIQILPPWYNTWWARTVWGLLLIGAVYLFILYRTRKIKLDYAHKVLQLSAEKEKELSERKLSFFTNISHEFRTPLTLIINPVKEMLLSSPESDKENLTIVHRNARRLLSLVDQLLIFRKADSDEDTLKVAALDIVSLCREVFLCFNFQARDKNIDYQFNCQAEKIELFADREKLEIALFNLLSNALKFTGSPGAVSCSLTQTEEYVLIKIRDSGCGIPHDNAIFSRFYQAQRSTSTESGFGIGLYLVKKLIESHKGWVSYHSKEGTGSVFKVRLRKGLAHFPEQPVFQDAQHTSALLTELMGSYEVQPVKGADVSLEEVTGRGLIDPFSRSILIVDDNAEIRLCLKKIFSADFLVYEATDGMSALELIQENLPDMVISDVLMPGMDGIELCSRIKTNPSFNHIPVILLTAGSSAEYKLRGIEEGADDYISKPFEKELLLARVASILKSKNNLQAYFHNEITLSPNHLKIPADYQVFISDCMKIVEAHMADADFSIKILTDEMGMSHSTLYKKVRSVSGQSLNGFIRSIRLRKAASLFLDTDCTVSEASYAVGINDPKYFREQFSKLFGLNPSEYIRKFRAPFHASLTRNASRMKAVKKPVIL